MSAWGADAIRIREGNVDQQITAVAVIVENGQLLTLRLPGQPGTVLPGGKVRSGEQVEDALRVHLKNRLGVEIDELEFHALIERTEGLTRAVRLLLVFDARLRAPATLSSDADAEVVWIRWDTITDPDLVPAVMRAYLPTGVLRDRCWWPASTVER